jgi:hypothetical protein
MEVQLDAVDSTNALPLVPRQGQLPLVVVSSRQICRWALPLSLVIGHYARVGLL